jgi:DNA invertase Pin-like site-specific DNA recombinase
MQVVGYTRVSSEDQARDGVSLDAQREKVRLFAELHTLDLVEVIVEAGVSAKSIDRPGLSRALAMLGDGRAAGLGRDPPSPSHSASPRHDGGSLPTYHY